MSWTPFQFLQRFRLTSQEDTHKGLVYAGYAAVHGSLTGQHGSYRDVADLHIPVHHDNPEEPLQPELHSRALQEGATLHSPKVPTFSLFSALHDSVLGKVRFSAA